MPRKRDRLGPQARARLAELAGERCCATCAKRDACPLLARLLGQVRSPQGRSTVLLAVCCGWALTNPNPPEVEHVQEA